MAAPVVQSLNDIVSQIQAAQAPENAQIDNSITQNETSGNAQTAGLNAAKDNAFGTITQNAVNRGGYFSGFTPDQQAKYTGSTYLPALAKLQSTIAATRNSLMGQKATLATQANTEGLTTQQNQQKELNAYNQQQEQNAFNAAEAEKQRVASVAAAQVRASSATPKAPSAADRQNAFNGQLGQLFQGYNPATDKWYTEKVVIPTLLQSGYDPATVAKQVYAYRKTAFGE